jgi:AraC-like DNA-binding protein
MQLDIVDLIQLFSIGIGLFLIVGILLKPSTSRRSAWLLASIILILCTNIFHDWSLSSRYILKVPHVLGLGPIHYYLIGPLLYCYIISQIKPTVLLNVQPKLSTSKFSLSFVNQLMINLQGKWLWVHFIPSVVFQINRYPIYFRTAEQKSAVLENYYLSEFVPSTPDNLLHFFANSLQDIHWLVYMIATIVFILRAKRNYIEIKPLTNLLILLILYTFIHISFQLLSSFNTFELSSNNVLKVRASIESILMYTIGFWSFTVNLNLDRNILKPIVQLSATEQQLITEIKQYIEKDYAYRNSKLSVEIVANDLHSTASKVSRVINQSLGIGFKDYINEHRINEACSRLNDGSYMTESQTLERLGYDVGFNSKSTFYRAFNKQLGLNPKQYLKR